MSDDPISFDHLSSEEFVQSAQRFPSGREVSEHLVIIPQKQDLDQNHRQKESVRCQIQKRFWKVRLI